MHVDGDEDLNRGGDEDTAAASRELLCRIPEETLFQLQQIYEAIEESNGISSNGSGGGGDGGLIGGKGSRRKSTSSLPSLTSLIYGSSGGGGRDEMAVEEPVEPGGGDAAEGSSRTPEKTTKVCCAFAFWRVIRPLVFFFLLRSCLGCWASKASFEHPKAHDLHSLCH